MSPEGRVPAIDLNLDARARLATDPCAPFKNQTVARLHNSYMCTPLRRPPFQTQLDLNIPTSHLSYLLRSPVEHLLRCLYHLLGRIEHESLEAQEEARLVTGLLQTLDTALGLGEDALELGLAEGAVDSADGPILS